MSPPIPTHREEGLDFLYPPFLTSLIQCLSPSSLSLNRTQDAFWISLIAARTFSRASAVKKNVIEVVNNPNFEINLRQSGAVLEIAEEQN